MAIQATSVIIVEPDLDTQIRYRQRLIAEPSIQVLGICSTISEALTLLAHNFCDVLFTELDLPDGHGADLIQTACTANEKTDAIVITHNSNDRDVARSIQAGAMGYILKGTVPHDIASCVRMVKAGGSPISPSVARSVLKTVRSQVSTPANEPFKPQEKSPLSSRETEILQLLAKGMSFVEISEVLQISCHTVTAHIKKIYRKLQVHSRGEAVYEASQMGILRDH